MKEELLHFIWKMNLLDPRSLRTQSQETLRVVKPGLHNEDSGPDFFDARVRIGETLWAGNVEIHLKSSDWYRHDHDKDDAFENVILHVVYEHDQEVYYSRSQHPVPVLELKNFISSTLIQKYQEMLYNSDWIPCASHIHKVPFLHQISWLERVLIERLEDKSSRIFDQLEKTAYDWQECFYRSMARYFGFNVNNEPFEQLASSLPSSMLARHKDNRFQIEALLFGQAGFLPSAQFRDDYPNQLSREFNFLKKKYGLKPLEPHQWKFMRTRPSNFPGIRISQLADLIHKSSHLFTNLLECSSPKEAQKLLNCNASSYWNSRYHFDKPDPSEKHKKLGKKSIENLLINLMAPFLYAYGQYHNKEDYKSRAIEILEELPPEQNKITRKWRELGIPNKNAARSQALIFLKKNYCDHKKCLNCQIGTQILKSPIVSG